jgi:hypothetical protein
MARAKKAKKKMKVRDLKARKTVKGGSKIARSLPADPCEGGEFSGKIG